MNRFHCALGPLVLVLGAGASRAEEPEKPAKASTYELDLTPPDLSAFALLEINPSQVSRPGTVREFSAALLNGVRSDGTITPGVAIEWSPVTTWTPDSLAEYQDNIMWRRITVSAATTADGAATRAALGARWVIVDDSDPIADKTLQLELERDLEPLEKPQAAAAAFLTRANTLIMATRFKPSEKRVEVTPKFSLLRTDLKEPMATNLCDEMKVVMARELKLAQDDINGRKEPAEAKKKALDQAGKDAAAEEQLLCTLAQDYATTRAQLEEEKRAAAAESTLRTAASKKAFREKVWNATTAQVGLGIVGRSDDSRWKSLEAERFRAFVNFATGVGTAAQLLFQADVTKEFVDEEDLAFGIGARTVIGSADFRGTGELYGQMPDDGPKLFSFAAGGELRIGPSIWLEFEVGGRKGGEVEGPAEMITRANIKYGSGAEQ